MCGTRDGGVFPLTETRVHPRSSTLLGRSRVGVKIKGGEMFTYKTTKNMMGAIIIQLGLKEDVFCLFVCLFVFLEWSYDFHLLQWH